MQQFLDVPVLHSTVGFSEMHFIYIKKNAENSTSTTCYIKLSELLTQHCTVEGVTKGSPK